MLEFVRFDAGAADFPPPRVPVLPPPAIRDLTWHRMASPELAGWADKRFWHYQRGRYALRDAYVLAGVGPGGGLLAPAYHCRTMLDPALTLGVVPLLYPLNADLSPDLGALARLLADAEQANRRIRALLITHYFGVPQRLDGVLDLCRRHRVELIEDCSHALVLDPALNASPALSGGIARSARLGVSSPYKFFACPDGGLLWADRSLGTMEQPARPANSTDELRATLRLLRDLSKKQHTGELTRAALPDLAPPQVADLRTQDNQPSADFNPANQHRRSLALSQKLAQHADLSRICGERRRRFTQWAQAVADMPGCRALVPQLDDHTIPYMFPLLLDEAWPAFHRLKHAGVPIWRWDQMAVSDCPVACEYRLRLLHLPCHQGLSDAQMAWMTTTVAAVMAASSSIAGNRR